MASLPFIPETITVHLGAPDAPAENVTVSFPDYIKNVASSEIYPTWNENALRANIYAQVSYALNRVYTEYYRSRGYDFNITNSTALDQSFVRGREVYENISRITDELFNDYLRRQGNVEPLFAQYCNGTTTTCDGLSQWGSESLASGGALPYEILQNYYGDDIEIVFDAPVEGITISVPYRPLRQGVSGDDVLSVQTRLNRISVNYPAIPKIANTNGLFGQSTEDAVREFQKIFNLTQDGVVGKATWYRIQYIYNGVKNLNSLYSEGIEPGELSQQFPEVLRQGDSGDGVYVIQYFLRLVSFYEETVRTPPQSGYFDEETEAAVRDFQTTYDLDADGIVGEITFYTLYDAYAGIVSLYAGSTGENAANPYPGTELQLGSSGESVVDLQTYLNLISEVYPSVPYIEPSGVFGVSTEESVRAFQSVFGIEPSGVVSARTWDAIAGAYDDILAGGMVANEQYPGYVIS